MERWKSILALGIAGVFVTTMACAQGTTPSGTTSSDTSDRDKSGAMKSPATADDTKSGTMKAESDTTKPGPTKSDDMRSDTMMKSGKRAAAGGNREQVRAAQQALKDKGHDPGAIDGAMGPKTQAALKEFQKAQGIQDTGRLDAETMAKLGIEGRTGAADQASPSASPSSSSSDASKGSSSSSSTQPSDKK